MEKEFTATEVCLILKQCGESGVSTFHFGRLKVTFGAPRSKFDVPLDLEDIGREVFPEQKQEAIVQEVIAKEEVALKESLLAQMEIEDPVEFERLMTMGDLVNSTDGDIDEADSGPEPAIHGRGDS